MAKSDAQRLSLVAINWATQRYPCNSPSRELTFSVIVAYSYTCCLVDALHFFKAKHTKGNMTRSPPVEHLHTSDSKSICSSPSTITCSVWSSGRSISTLELLSTARPISSITFSSGFSEDDEDFVGCQDMESPSKLHFHHPRGVPQHAYSDPFALSERSLFQERLLSPIPSKNDNAPKAPSRLQNKDDIISCPFFKALADTRPGNRGADVKPRMPTRSSHGDEDNGSIIMNSETSVDSHRQSPNSSDSEKRRKKLLNRLDATQQVLDSSSHRRKAAICTSGPKQYETIPPKLPVRTSSSDILTPRNVTNATGTNDAMSPLLIDDSSDGDGLVSNNRRSGSMDGKDIDGTTTTKLQHKKSKVSKSSPKLRAKKRTTNNGNNITTTEEGESRDEPSSSHSTITEPTMYKRGTRSRSKDPPKRFATAPAFLGSSGCSSQKTSYIPKRYIKNHKSTSEQRLRRQFVSNSLTSILEDENENTTSPVRGGPKAPVSCPSKIETTILEDKQGPNAELPPAPRTRGRSWVGTGSRNLL